MCYGWFQSAADLEVFTSLLRSLLQIPLDADAARRLFNALTLNQSDGNCPVSFSVWKLHRRVFCFYFYEILVDSTLATRRIGEQ